jgi:pimeloyl-ACP methyl ester carboxylesterase
MRRRILTHPDGPTRSGAERGLAYTLWLPPGEPAGGVVILHGAGSCKENHHDFARAARDAGLAAVAFDQRGHGATGGALDGRAIEDVARIAGLLPPGPVALRGSSMGGYLAIVAAERAGAAAVVAICPAAAESLARGLRSGRLGFAAERPALEALLAEHDLELATRQLRAELLLMHAEGDDQVPVAQSRALAAAAPRARLIAVPGGHHRFVQHDPELQGESLRFLSRALAAAR